MPDQAPLGDRSIRNIPVPASHRRLPIEEAPKPSPRRRRRRNRLFLWVVLAVVLLCIAGGLLLSTSFSGTTIHVTPRSQVVTAPATMTAEINPGVGVLAYQVLTASRTASTTVGATGTQQVSQEASGIITIYDDYSTANQELVATTRFEAPDGTIYRIHSNVVVPGATENSDGSLTPGSVSLTAYANAPGASYNRGATQFTIPGFENTPRYSKFYAQTEGMSGGFVGTEPAVAPADLATAELELKSGLDEALQVAASTGIPSEFLPISGSLTITYDDVVQSPGEATGTATVSQTASATEDVVRATDLAAAIAAQTVQGYGGEAVGFADSSAISVALASTTKQTNGVLGLTLSGMPTLVWQFDPNTLKQALLGKPKSQFETIVESFAPAIQCTAATPCSASIRPFWLSSFPTDPNKITIVTGS